MEAGGVVDISLVSTQCNGMIVHGFITSRPGDANYQATLKQYALAAPGDSRPVMAAEAEPCPRWWKFRR